MKRIPLLLAVICAAALSVAQGSVNGVWKGKLDLKVDMTKVPEAQRELAKTQIEAAKKTTMTLTLKAGNAFVLDVVGTGRDGKTNKSSITGTWSIANNKVKYRATKNNGKDIPKEYVKDQFLTVSNGNKTLTMNEKGPMATVTVVFSR